MKHLMICALSMSLLTGVVATDLLGCSVFADECSSCIAGKLAKQDELLGIVGKITRRDGAVIAGARVRIIYRSGKNVLFSRVTDSNEEYHALGLPPGIYDVEVKAAGFKQAQRKLVQVLLGGNQPYVNVNFVMETCKK